jgi:MPBQ/MSBQ methyltransferase
MTVRWSMRPSTYDRMMRGSNQRRYYGDSGYFNFGYWGAGAKSQREASEALVDQMVARSNRPGRILDVACGLGGSTRRLTQTYPPGMITGINISEAQIADARALAPGCAFAVMNATELDFPDDHFDAVICIEGACHFDTRDKFLQEAHRVLKPGGSLALADMLFATGILSEFGQVPRANLLSSIAEYGARLAAAGFVAIEVTDATEHCLGGFRANLARWAGGRGAPRRAHDIIAKPCRGHDRQAVGRLLRLELQDLSAGLGAQTVLSAPMGTGFTFWSHQGTTCRLAASLPERCGGNSARAYP